MSSEQDTERTPRRRRSPAAVASVAAAVLLVGGGGAYWAASAGGDGAGNPREPGGAPPLLALDGHTDAGAGGVGARGTGPTPSGSGPGIAPGEPDPHGGFGGRVVYRAAGDLPDGPERAAVHRAQGLVSEGEVRRLAQALGLMDTPTRAGGTWVVGAVADGSGPQLRVDERAPGAWTFARHPTAEGSVDCVQGKQCAPGTPVGEETAKKAAAPVLKALGIEDAKLDAGQVLGGARVVNADPVVGGLPTYGWMTGIPVGPDGRVRGGSGQLKGLTKGAEYPVVGAQEALGLLNRSGRGGALPDIGGCATPVPVEKDRGQVEPVAPGEGTEPSPGLGRIPPCEPRQVPQRTVTVDSAVFGLSAQYADGQRMLVPSWLFRIRPTGDEKPYTVTYPAVEPKFLKAPGPSVSASPPGPSDGPAAPGRHVESYSADGRKLTLSFWGGVCSTYTAEVTERDRSVEVRIVETETEPGRACIAIAKKLTATATLDGPLDGREVLGEGGEAVPKG
ncbi:hypothetical protein [Streptomyces candidus]|uniref:Large membrane protein n=1 Tax=Streptomyces candidus TaxID=67283 RepID=A0A7X0H9Z2_9ACTN|nr:hypothetical protein [Streptomyces candidus]MBB6433802.1 hypothetical protein [Streptomyces candidus]GHH34510.1 membrane protein [Streptomyces candidus]